MVHRLKDGLYGMRAKGVRFINITPTAEDLDTGGAIGPGARRRRGDLQGPAG